MIKHISFFLNKAIEQMGVPVCSVCGKKYDYRSDALACCTDVNEDDDIEINKDRSAA